MAGKLRETPRLFRCILTVAVLFLIILTLIKPAVVDGIILQEKRNPVYWEMFGHDSIRYFYKDNATNDVFDEIDYFETWVKEYSQAGIKIQRGYSDGSLIISGETDENMFIHLNSDNFSLPVGLYTISDGLENADEVESVRKNEERLEIYIEVFDEKGSQLLGSSKGRYVKNVGSDSDVTHDVSDTNVFEIMENSNTPVVCLWIKPGFSSEGIKIFPRITGSPWFETSYFDNCVRDYNNNKQMLSKFAITTFAEEIPYKDYKFFLNSLNSNNYDVDRFTILVDTKHGICYGRNSDLGIYGTVNKIGEIEHVLGYIKDTGSYLVLVDKDGVELTRGHSDIGINGL